MKKEELTLNLADGVMALMMDHLIAGYGKVQPVLKKFPSEF